MNTYKVIYRLSYPDADNDIRTAYVLADSFKDAQQKVETRYKKQFESAYVQSMELLDSDIIV